jgi:hypothetical protein
MVAYFDYPSILLNFGENTEGSPQGWANPICEDGAGQIRKTFAIADIPLGWRILLVRANKREKCRLLIFSLLENPQENALNIMRLSILLLKAIG